MELEAYLLRLVTHHDATHGERLPLPDSIIIEKAKLNAAEANLGFDSGEFNFSTKWLYKWKQHNNTKHTHFHGEGEDANLTSVAIVR